MAAVRQIKKRQSFSDPKAMLRFLEEQDARTGFVFDPTVTAEKVREMMLACGVRPELRTAVSAPCPRHRTADRRLVRAGSTEGLVVLNPAQLLAPDVPAYLASL